VDRWLDSPRLLNWAAQRGLKTDAADLGALTVSMLEGENGPDQKEFAKLVDWLADDVRPEVVDLSNSLLTGLAGSIKRRLRVPVVCSLSGEDLFLEGLSEPWHGRSLKLLRRRVADIDAFVAFNHYYASFMADYLQIPHSKLFQVPLGVNLDGHAASDGCAGQVGEPAAKRELVVGYLARVCPEKGIHVLCEAFRILRQQSQFATCRLRVAGYLSPRDRPFWDELQRQIAAWGLSDSVEYAGEVDRAGKIQFLQSLDVFSVPTVYRESKGLPVLEAWANCIPVVQPWHGVFTELLNASQGGLLVSPNDPQALADGLAQLLDNAPLRAELGQRGRAAVERSFTADRMAEATLAVYQKVSADVNIR
jgi:glycosyltransferase involved in cell wall biosynthesis